MDNQVEWIDAASLFSIEIRAKRNIFLVKTKPKLNKILMFGFGKEGSRKLVMQRLNYFFKTFRLFRFFEFRILIDRIFYSKSPSDARRYFSWFVLNHSSIVIFKWLIRRSAQHHHLSLLQ